MSDDVRLRSALTAIAEGDAVRPLSVDLRRLERARRTRRLWVAAGTAVIVVGTGTLAVQTGTLERGGGGSGADAIASQPGDATLPRVARVRCTSLGTTVDPLRIAAAPDGVHLNIADDTGSDISYLNYGSGGEPAPAIPIVRILAWPPGTYDLNCFHGEDAAEDESVTLTVVDPEGYYEAVDSEAVLGCVFTGQADGPVTTGATGRAAADAYVAQYVPGATLTLAAGYREDPSRGYLLDSEVEKAGISVFPNDDGGYSAAVGPIC
jgi:hypothetical protein